MGRGHARKGTHAPPRYLWYCTRCRNTVTGPRSPGRGAPCRVCVDCSIETGAERMRHRSGRWTGDGEPSHARPGAEPDAEHLVGGFNLRSEFYRLVDLPVVPPEVRANPPTLHVSRDHAMGLKGGLAEHAGGQYRITVATWVGIHPSFALASLVHELGHVIAWPGSYRNGVQLPGRGPSGYDFHGEHWRSACIELLREGYNVDPPFIRTADGRTPTWMLDLAMELSTAFWLGRAHGQTERISALLSRVRDEVAGGVYVVGELAHPNIETKEL